jgi:hypothetical protein
MLSRTDTISTEWTLGTTPDCQDGFMDEVDAATFLMVKRGNTASGKNTTATALREHIGGQRSASAGLLSVAIAPWRRKKVPVRDAVPMIDSIARAASTAGCSVILEGVFNSRLAVTKRSDATKAGRSALYSERQRSASGTTVGNHSTPYQ